MEEQLADEDNEDVYGLSRVADVLHALMSAYHESFFPHLDSLLPHLVQLLGPGRPYADRQWAICIFDDVIEFGGKLMLLVLNNNILRFSQIWSKIKIDFFFQ